MQMIKIGKKKIFFIFFLKMLFNIDLTLFNENIFKNVYSFFNRECYVKISSISCEINIIIID